MNQKAMRRGGDEEIRDPHTSLGSEFSSLIKISPFVHGTTGIVDSLTRHVDEWEAQLSMDCKNNLVAYWKYPEPYVFPVGCASGWAAAGAWVPHQIHEYHRWQRHRSGVARCSQDMVLVGSGVFLPGQPLPCPCAAANAIESLIGPPTFLNEAVAACNQLPDLQEAVQIQISLPLSWQ